MQAQERNAPGGNLTSTAAARQALDAQRRRPEARALSRAEEDYFAEVRVPQLRCCPKGESTSSQVDVQWPRPKRRLASRRRTLLAEVSQGACFDGPLVRLRSGYNFIATHLAASA